MAPGDLREERRTLGGVLAAVGDTPLVRLERLLPDAGFEVWAKLEALNPGGSIKDRTALSMLRGALERGDLRAGSTVVESSSGNLAIGLAQACRYFGLRLICVVDANITAANLAILRAFGAEAEMVEHPDPATGQYLPARLRRVRELLASHEDAFWPDQYANLDNTSAHHETMREIVTALDGHVDYLLCATGTCGTLRGCVEYVREQGLSTRVVAVDAVGSVIFGTPARPRLIPGHGAGVRPALLEDDLADQVIHIDDLECVMGCRRLLRREGILAGGSSGAVVAALDGLADRIPASARCALVFPDRGERYLETVYNDAWVTANLGPLGDSRSDWSRPWRTAE
jgi:2,3-diaminopropionate biosynthesis protein SbnA